MKVSILSDTKQIGKTLQGSRHPITGVIHTKEFNSVEGFASIIENLTSHECFTVGLYPDNYHYVPGSDVENLTKPRYIARTKSNAIPGHIFVIDCDHPKFAHLKGPHLHKFLVDHLPDIFAGAGYVATKSTSSYLKQEDKFHQYYFFETATDMSQLFILVERLFMHHNMITSKLASNYSRSYIYTPIDVKLNELQQPIFEMSKDRLNSLGLKQEVEITVHQGDSIRVSAMHLPNPELSNVQRYYDIIKQQAEKERELKYAEYASEHGLTTAAGSSLEKKILPPTLELQAVITGAKVSMVKTTLLEMILNLIKNGEIPHEKYLAIGEPEYANRQTAKIFYDTPFKLSTYRMYDHAHGGTNYVPVFNYDEMYDILSAAKEHIKNPRQFMGLATARTDLTSEDIEILSGMFHKSSGISGAKLAKFMTQSANKEIIDLQESLEQIPQSDLMTLLASIEGDGKIDMSDQLRALLREGIIDEQALFKPENVEIIRTIVASLGTEVVTKPGPLNSFNVATKTQTIKNLAQTYPLTNISPRANELAMDAAITKFTATKKIETVLYKSSLHGEKLYFSGNSLEVVYQQPKPSFENVSDPVKVSLDLMSATQESEFRDIYLNESIGDIWSYIAELIYIKKVYPELKKDFLWLNFASDVGKTYNMEVANTIAPFEKTNLDQLLEQASKVIPSSVAKSTFLFHDEVKNFKHNWNELGAMHKINGMHSNGILTQLPLKILASAENTMSKGTKQQLNRLMVYKSGAKKSFKEIVEPQYWADFGALTHKIIYEKFDEAYNKYARLPQGEALKKAILTSSSIAAQLAPKDMMVTEDVVKDAIIGYLLQEYINDGLPADGLDRYVKRYVIKNNILYVNFKKVDAPAFIEYVLRATTSSIESRSMNYEALSITWADIGAYNLDKPKTIGGQSGFYGQTLEIEIPEGMRYV